MFTVTPSPLLYLNAIARTEEQKKAFFRNVRKNFCAVVNVADTPCAVIDFQQEHIPSFWFPILEFGYWGYQPFFATLRVLDWYYVGEKSILIHCHQGAHRSPIVAYTIMIALGYSTEGAEEWLDYKGLSRILERDIRKNRIPADIIPFLKLASDMPDASIKDIGKLMGKSRDFTRDCDDKVKNTYDLHKLTKMGSEL
jgi:hypothetical protein